MKVILTLFLILFSIPSYGTCVSSYKDAAHRFLDKHDISRRIFNIGVKERVCKRIVHFFVGRCIPIIKDKIIIQYNRAENGFFAYFYNNEGKITIDFIPVDC